MRQKGFGQITILIALVIVVVLASAASYYILKSAGKAPSQGLVPVATSTPQAPTGEVSDSDEASVIESELNSTTLDSIDTDIQNLETSASSL